MDKYKHSMVHKCLLSRGHINSHHLIFSSLSPFLISFIPNPPFLWLPSLRLLVPQHSSPQFFMFSPPSRTIFASIQRAHISWHLRVSFTHSIHLALIHSFSPFSFINPFKSSFSSSLHRLCALQHMWALRSKSFFYQTGAEISLKGNRNDIRATGATHSGFVLYVCVSVQGGRVMCFLWEFEKCIYSNTPP